MMDTTKFIQSIVGKSKSLAVDVGLYDDTRPFTKLLKDKKSLVGVEIGVCTGINSLSMLEKLDISMLYGVDPYLIYDEYKESWYEDSQDFFNAVKQEAYDRLRPYLNNYTFVKKFSVDAIDFIPDDLDFVYIDGNHDYDFVKQDIELWFPKIKSGGVIGGHDFFNMNEHFGVHKAVIEFAVNNNLDLFFKNPDWWFFKL